MKCFPASCRWCDLVEHTEDGPLRCRTLSVFVRTEWDWRPDWCPLDLAGPDTIKTDHAPRFWRMAARAARRDGKLRPYLEPDTNGGSDGQGS